MLPGYRIGAALNMLASLASLLFALTLLWDRPATGAYLLVDDLNIVFVLLNCFIGFTTSAFSASYIGHELQTGRLKPIHLRFYHAMFQLMLFGMNLALLANNIGLMWVAVELATLTTVMMVGLYRTAEALEAAWKYFILGSVGIALALFGTILVYLAARPVVGEGMDAMIWTNLLKSAPKFDPSLLNIAFIFLLLGYGTKVGLAPLHAWLPDAHAEGPTPISAVLSGPAAECRLVCAAAVQDAARRQPARHRARAADDRAGPAVADLRRVHAVPAARHQTPVRLFIHRAHGHHRLRLRHGRSAGQLRRPAADDHAQPDQVGDLLLGRPRRPGEGHAADRRDRRPDREPSVPRLGAGGRGRGDHRAAAVRRVHQRVPGGVLDLRARAGRWR